MKSVAQEISDARNELIKDQLLSFDKPGPHIAPESRRIIALRTPEMSGVYDCDKGHPELDRSINEIVRCTEALLGTNMTLSLSD